MGESFSIPFMLDAIKGALSIIASLGRTPDIDAVVLEAYALREAVESWRVRLPTADEREATVQRVLRLHAHAVRCARTAETGWVSFDQVRAEGAAASQRSSEHRESERPTTPPPFDIESFARRADAGEVDASRDPYDPTGPAESGTSPVAAVAPPPSSVRALRSSSAPPGSTSAAPPIDRTGAMVDLLSRGDHEGALELADLVLAEAPSNPIAIVCREQCLATLEEAYVGRLGQLHRLPIATLATDLTHLDLDHRAGFLMSLMDGRTTLEGVLDLCAMPKPVAMMLIVELIDRRIVTLR
jgi:hypothetical protein